jgi:hypothetical protein
MERPLLLAEQLDQAAERRIVAIAVAHGRRRPRNGAAG